MEPLFLAKLFGLYFLIVGAVVMLKQTTFMPAMSQLIANRGVLFLIAFIELAAGLAVVLAYPEVSLDWMGIISLVGWVMIVESVFYLALPASKVQKFIRSFSKPSWYSAGAVLSIVLGAYLSGIGFGFIS